MIENQIDTIPQLTGLNILTEKVEDIPLLVGQMIRMGLAEILDRHIPRHARQRKLSWGWTAIIWLAYILSEGDHRKISVAKYVAETLDTLVTITGQVIDVLDFDDDRLSHLIRHLSNEKIWQAVERDLSERCIEVYELPTRIIRCDPTTVSGHHEVEKGGVMQFGHSKDDPNLPQIKLSAASLDPLGMPLVTEVVSGEKADDGLYRELINRVRETLKKNGLLFIGDCKMSSLENRALIVESENSYLAPLPQTGNTAKSMPEWISLGCEKDKDGSLEPIFRMNDKEEIVLAACGYELERTQSAQLTDKDGENKEITWTERVIIVCSPAHAAQQESGLENRLDKAQNKIKALTPQPGRGKRQIREEKDLNEKIDKIIEEHHVEGLLNVKYEEQRETESCHAGKGHGSEKSEKKVTEKVRYQIIEVTRNEDAIDATIKRFGWKIFVTNADKEVLSLNDAILCYRDEYRIEKIFSRLKGRLNIAPMFVKRDDQIEGLTYLLTLGVRVLTLIEFVIRRSLQMDNSKLPDLHPENRNKKTNKPTAERILKVFSNISLTIIRDAYNNVIFRSVTFLSAVQQSILNMLGLNDIYAALHNTG